MIAYSPAPAIAAMLVRARRKIVGHFFAMHAISADEAVAFEPDSHILRRQFETMQARGIVRAGAPGTFWVDVAALNADHERRRWRLVPIAIVLIVIGVVVPLFLYKG
ncbi:hypothetical protein [Sphingomonas hengshuiensis]|uniref:Uncharacterized protein n=1 Tax=Sphingomonas hengshuiensis TaxID=1609977 RepID=A0A7U5BEU1_9SPHN|nr:hypothetical protein [Sphingomonas hengshuiensis]AJP70948.1 hypothetical protein TS85_02590 [Sphingomonas hengshuiensis]